MLRRVRALVAASVVAALGATGCAGGTGGSDTITFGVSGPKTGNQAHYGADWQEGFDLAVETINARGGVNGKKVAIDFQDSQGEAAQASTIAQRFVSDSKISAVMGDFSSATSMVASPIYQRGKLVQLGITNSHPDFTKAGDYIFAPSITQEVEQRFLADGVAKLGKNVAVFHLNTDWGNTAYKVFADQAKKDGMTIVSTAPVAEASTDFRPQLIQARDAKPDVVVFLTYYATTSLLVQQADQVGLGAVPQVAVSSNYSTEFLNLAKDGAESVRLPTAFFPGSSNEATRAFVRDFTAKYHHEPNSFNAVAYDGVLQLAYAAGKGNGTREGIQKVLATDADIPSVIYGKVRYDSTRRIANPTFTWLQVQQGRFVQADPTR